MHLRLLAAVALAIGLSSPASAQTVQVVQDCAGVQATTGPGGRLYTNQDGRLCVVTATGSTTVTNPGTPATQAQAVQGVPNGVPQRVTPADADAALTTYSLTATGQTAPVLTSGYGSVLLDLSGTFVATIQAEVSSDAAADCTGGTWNTMLGFIPNNAGSVASGITLDSTTRRREYRATDGHCFRVNVTGYTSGTVVATIARRIAPVGERSVWVGGGVVNPVLSSAGTNRSATVSTTAANLMAANATRRGWKIKNDCANNVWINLFAIATAAAGSGNIKIVPGFYLASEPNFVETGAMSAIAEGSPCALTASEH